jgi:hypothetical protein
MSDPDPGSAFKRCRSDLQEKAHYFILGCLDPEGYNLYASGFFKVPTGPFLVQMSF